MKNRTLLIISLFMTSSFFSQSEKDKKLDVANPEGSFKEVDFTTTEGTWMSLDLSPVGKKISFTSDAGGGDNICTMNTDGTDAKKITKETFRLLNNAVWTPDDNYLIARKHFSSTRSLGAGELWMYHISGGEGVQLTTKRNEQQDTGEPCASADGKFIYYSEDTYPGGYFQYNKNPLENIRNTEFIKFVMVNGRMYETSTMNQIGNYDVKCGNFYWNNAKTNSNFEWHEESKSFMGGCEFGD
jgi:Tol biopolymer transport system component